MRKSKIALIAIVGCIGLAAAFGLNEYRKAKGENYEDSGIIDIMKSEIFNIGDDKSDEKEYAKVYMNIMRDDGQIVDTGDVKVTLEKYYFDEEINQGYCLFSLVEDGKEGKDIACNYYHDVNFGGDDYSPGCDWDDPDILKYHFELNTQMKKGTGGVIVTDFLEVECVGEKKYIYYEFWINANGFQDAILVMNKGVTTMDIDYSYIGQFDLKDNVEWREFSNGKDKIEVSCLSVRINDGTESDKNDISDLVIYMKDGRKHTVSDNDMVEVTYEHKTPTTRLNFHKPINVDDISYISWKGEKIQG